MAHKTEILETGFGLYPIPFAVKDYEHLTPPPGGFVGEVGSLDVQGNVSLA